MHTNAPAVFAARAQSSALALHTRATFLRRDLTAALRQRPRQAPAAALPRMSADEMRAVREAVPDPRSTRERVLDRVADRLMRELAL